MAKQQGNHFLQSNYKLCLLCKNNFTLRAKVLYRKKRLQARSYIKYLYICFYYTKCIERPEIDVSPYHVSLFWLSKASHMKIWCC